MTCTNTVFDNDKNSNVNISKNELGFDAWDRAKTVSDFSLFHGMFTFDVPFTMWVEEINSIEQPVRTNFSSASGALLCTGVDGQVNTLISKRHPRYQPNRGWLYSGSMLIDTATNNVNHDFGAFTDTSGLFFRVILGQLFAILRTTINGVTTDKVRLTSFTGDLVAGNVYDIQAQWRGVGNIKFFVNLELVYTFDNLGTLGNLSVNNPALPMAFSLNGLGSMRCGCVDLTSEGGGKDTRQLGFANTGEISLASTETAVLILQMERLITYEGDQVRNTQDIALRRISGYADDNTLFKIYYTRDATKFTGSTFTPTNSGGLGHSMAINGGAVIDDLLGMDLFESTRIPANGSKEVENPDQLYGDLYLTGGDFLVVTLEAKNQTLGGASLDWGTEI